MTARLAAAALALLVAAPASAFVRTRDRSTGEELFWAVPAVPWYLNRDWPSTAPSCQATPSGDPTLAAAEASFAAWEQSCSNLRLVPGGTSGEIRTGVGGSNENLVVFRRGWCSQDADAKFHPCKDDPAVDCGGLFGCFDDACPADATNCADWSVVALTSVLYEPDTGRILDADIEINGWDGVPGTIVTGTNGRPQHGWYFTCFGTQPGGPPCASYGEGGCVYMDLQNTLTHEVGHFIGLAHAPSSAATMFATTSTGDVEKRSLASDDVAGVCEIYPEPDGNGCGCGSGGAGGALALLVAGLALRRRRGLR